MDGKPLLQERPPAYSPVLPGGYEYGQPGSYGAIAPPQPGFQPPPPYAYPGASGYPAPPPQGPLQPSFPSTYTIIQQPVTTTTSVVVVGGCPACRSCDTSGFAGTGPVCAPHSSPGVELFTSVRW
ncbi:brain protein I3 isoform X3 [Rhinatrema bivittatum]|uniref:brain protein I3 isoform X3 n=1 Tax=Rhinatrema bivittatum TaxID=194408 RepID=UPI00112CB5CA|nr:brain protein I3 isoform X3 [Rhinatrema bivittatum]